MNVTIAYCMAGLSTLSLIVLWFVNTHKVLRRKRDAVRKAQEELRLHQNGYNEKRVNPRNTANICLTQAHKFTNKSGRHTTKP